MPKKNKRLILIDSNALIHRAFHALPELSKKDGTLTNAVYGFALTLLSVIDKLKPDYIAAAFDLKAPTFRHKKYEKYKSTRQKAPDELYMQIPLVKKMLKAFNIPIYELRGYEADDIIGTLAKDKKLNGDLEKFMVTGDLDILQLVDKQAKVFTLRKGIKDTVIYDEKAVEDRFELKPGQVVDYKALRGDASDNIPGVKGIGEKTATELLKKFKNLEGIYKNLDKVSSEAVRKKLEFGKEDAFMSYDLAKIRTDVPIKFKLEDCNVEDYNKQKVIDFFKEIEFYSMVKRLEESQNGKSSKKKSGKEKVKIKIIKQKEEIKKIINSIQKKRHMAIEAEDKTGVAIALEENSGNFVVGSPKDNFSKIIADKKIEKTAFNFKKLLELFYRDNPKMINKIENYFDIKLGAYLLKSGAKIEFENLIFEEFGENLEHKITKNGQANLLNDSQETKQKEMAEKTAWALKLKKRYSEELKSISEQQDEKNNLVNILENLEKPVLKILAKMELAGVKTDGKILKTASQEARQKIGKLEKEIYKLAGEKFNINSPAQLAPILYEKLEIPTEDIRRGKTGYSTDSDQLRKIRHFHPIVEKIENFRELSKVKNTYTDALPKLISPDGRIYTTFHQTTTATGRLSSSSPNLQNIPKKGELAKKIRQAFQADKGKILVSADYSQIDLRVAAHASNDELMIKGFREGKDIHRITAAWVNDIKEESVSDKQRSEAKSLNFGVLYGMGIYGFMRDSGVDRARAEGFIEQYMKKFSGLKKYLDETKEFARNKGYVETEIGRRRYIKNINASNYQLRSMAERMAINLPIQGLAADIMKMAMIEVEEKIMKNYGWDEAKIILQIHDELIFEVDKKIADKFMQEVKKVMEKVYKLKVPLVVDVAKGKNWEEI